MEQFACRTGDEERQVIFLIRAQPEKFLIASIVHRRGSKVGYGLKARMLSLSETRGTTWSIHMRQEWRCDISVSGYSPGLQRLHGVAAVRKNRDRAVSEVGTESPWLEGSCGMAMDKC